MPPHRRVAISVELDWPYDRHLGVLAGTQRFSDECGRWDCVVDEVAHLTLRRAREGGLATPYDGIIARATRPLAEEAGRLGVPVVNTWFDSPASSLPCVAPAFPAVGRLAADHLLGLGLRRFACISARDSRANALAVGAFHAAVADAGLACQCIAISERQFARRGRRDRFHRDLARQIVSWKPPIGVFVVLPDMTSRHVATECRKRGLRIPDDVALVAGMNEPILCLHPQPSLTSIETSYAEVGYRAAETLDKLMDGEPPPGRPLFLPPVGVIARQSTNYLAVDDAVVRAALEHMAAPGQRRASVPDIAAAVGVSRRTLERRFVAVLGRTVAEQIRRLRIERAKRHLADPELKIGAVARMAGFANEQRLYEAFRRQEGTSPAQFRAERTRPH